VPVVVRPSDDGFELVAGFHRIAAAAQLGLPEIPVVVRDVETEESDRAVENIARKQLNPYEEARAVKAISETSDIALTAGRAYPRRGISRVDIASGGQERKRHNRAHEAAVRWAAASGREDRDEARTFVFDLAKAYVCRVEAPGVDLGIAQR
jgi:ParB-like nuclease domain